MSDMGRTFTGSMPEFYDRFLVPLMFAPFARHMAKCIDGMPAGDLLEIAAGTGIVTRELARLLPEPVRITATDSWGKLDFTLSNPAEITGYLADRGIEYQRLPENSAAGPAQNSARPDGNVVPHSSLASRRGFTFPREEEGDE